MNKNLVTYNNSEPLVPFKEHVEVLNSILNGLKFLEEKYIAELDTLQGRVTNGEMNINSEEYKKTIENINTKYFAELKSTPTFNETSNILHRWKMNEAIIDHYTDVDFSEMTANDDVYTEIEECEDK